jgi:hypothetical protein
VLFAASAAALPSCDATLGFGFGAGFGLGAETFFAACPACLALVLLGLRGFAGVGGGVGLSPMLIRRRVIFLAIMRLAPFYFR